MPMVGYAYAINNIELKGNAMTHLFGYLDPGTGSLAVQSIVGAAIGLAYTGRKTIANLVGRLRKKPTTEE